MPKITFIGAGSITFTRNLTSDILLTPALQESTITLMDVDETRLQWARNLVQSMIDRRGLKARVEATTDRRAAIKGADYVVTTFQVGGLSAYQYDIEIPERYGVEQCVGDTLNPGGIFRALRSIPLLLDICREMDELAPNALLLNNVNPMVPCCWAIDRAIGRPFVGLCHSAQGTTRLMARWSGVPYSEVTYLVAGINHLAFVLEFKRGKDDLYPRFREAAHEEEFYGREPLRIQMMDHLGYFVTESSGHLSEYVPYFRKNTRMVNEELAPQFKFEGVGAFDQGRTGGYLRWSLERRDAYQQEYEAYISGEREDATERTPEYASAIMEAMETNQPITINGNVPNRGAITNLPADCCVEVPCVVDGNGVQRTIVGDLPRQLAALIRTNVNVQDLTVEAALTLDRAAVYHAVSLDPLTAAVLTLPQIHAMVDEMLEAQARWLPSFINRRRSFARATA
ncbi:MAG TPA: alpha-glucosidase/alpha-galactosidase [Ardenticatenaceae bacterium]|jgi:alpha-galactosidase